MKHCHFSILYNELPFLKQKLPFLYEYFDQIIFYDLNVACEKPHFSTDGSHEYILDYPDPKNKISIVEETDLSRVTKYYGGSGIAKRKMFTLASQYVREEMDVFWCTDMDEFFNPSLLQEVESTFLRHPQVNSINLKHYYFWKDFDLILCDPTSDTGELPPRIARHKPGNIYGHCSLHEQYPETKVLDSHQIYHFAWLGEERFSYKINYWCSPPTGDLCYEGAYRKYAEEIWGAFNKENINPNGKMWGYPHMHPNPLIKKGVKFFKGKLPSYIDYLELTADLGIKTSTIGIKVGQEKINPKVLRSVPKLKDDFSENAFVEVADFLSDSFAEYCYDFYFKKMPSDWWRAASLPNIDSSKSDLTLQYEREDKSETYQHCLKHFDKGDFCYFFHRTVDDHEKSCDCGECDIRRFFKSNEMFSFLSDLSGRQISSDSGHFSSWYKKGNFLSAHQDDGNGSIGVVLDFVKNWNPVFGGNLFILEDDWTTCKKVIAPKFNNLKVFDIPKETKGVPHFVSTVLADSDLGKFSERKRIAFGGWFN